MMKRHNLDFLPAYELVKAKRRFVQPNAGFVSQLKLFRRMGCKIDPNCQRYKIHRLRLAGEQMRKNTLVIGNRQADKVLLGSLCLYVCRG